VSHTVSSSILRLSYLWYSSLFECLGPPNSLILLCTFAPAFFPSFGERHLFVWVHFRSEAPVPSLIVGFFCRSAPAHPRSCQWHGSVLSVLFWIPRTSLFACFFFGVFDLRRLPLRELFFGRPRSFPNLCMINPDRLFFSFFFFFLFCCFGMFLEIFSFEFLCLEVYGAYSGLQFLPPLFPH